MEDVVSASASRGPHAAVMSIMPVVVADSFLLSQQLVCVPFPRVCFRAVSVIFTAGRGSVSESRASPTERNLSSLVTPSCRCPSLL